MDAKERLAHLAELGISADDVKPVKKPRAIKKKEPIDDAKLVLLGTHKEWQYKLYLEAFRKAGVSPSVRVTPEPRMDRVYYAVWARLTPSQTAILKHIVRGLGLTWSCKDDTQRITVV